MLKFLLILLFPISCFATNTVIYNSTTKTIEQGNLCCEEVSIASISKLMTIYTVLEANQNLEEKIVVPDSNIRGRLSKGMVVSRLDVIKLALVSSDNLAAITLANNYPGGQIKFIQAMNFNTKELNMQHTRFIEPTGLSTMNYSTIGDVVTMTNALVKYQVFKDAAKVKELSIVAYKNNKPKVIHSRPTSTYFGDEKIIALKTGFTNAAGFCITMIVNSNNQLYNVVVLGSRTPNERSRIVKELLTKLK
jgi:D-alanyl-D-alanine endopeptidase (penicillin-binding protein 7)